MNFYSILEGCNIGGIQNYRLERGLFERATLPVCHTDFYFFGPLKASALEETYIMHMKTPIHLAFLRSEQPVCKEK